MSNNKQEVIEETGSFPTSNLKDLIEVNEYGLFAFCSKIQELIKQGYEIDLTSNVRAPMSYGTMFVAYMIPTPESEVLPTDTVVEKPHIESKGFEGGNTNVPLTEEKVQDKPTSEPKVPKVSRKSGAAE